MKRGDGGAGPGRVWMPALSLEGDGGTALFRRISHAIVNEIRSGRLTPGTILPGSRALAESLGLHRNTVVASYRELEAEGWLVTELGRGTFVAPAPPGTGGLPRGRGVAAEPGYPVAQPLPFEFPPPRPPGTFVLTRGAPDVRLLPTAELARAYRRVLLRDARALLTYGDPHGHSRLRQALSAMLAVARGIDAPPAAILVTRGSQMALDLIARAVFEPGDVVAVEALGSPPVWTSFRTAGLTLLPVPVDAGGLCVDDLVALSRRQRIRAVYVTPHHQFPTTSVMPVARRTALLEFARANRVAVIEDDYDHEFHYDGRPVTPLAAQDDAGTVIYVGTLSKVLAPGLRMGFVVAPPPVIERMTSLRVSMDLQGDLAAECAVAEFFESGGFGRHVRRMRRIYRSRRDALVEALRNELGQRLAFTVPSGGMALWLRAHEEVDVDRWASAAALEGVVIRSGRMYDFGGASQSHLRLGFTCHDERELQEAVHRMAAALKGL
ncbi:MAG TPA: PLP-dependent aminotransferase family protein [Gemmatimonadales bacterium]|nr:PLP-dependent aminotransferase family protein [Gemmatimonadales bacterium]